GVSAHRGRAVDAEIVGAASGPVARTGAQIDGVARSHVRGDAVHQVLDGDVLAGPGGIEAVRIRLRSGASDGAVGKVIGRRPGRGGHDDENEAGQNDRTQASQHRLHVIPPRDDGRRAEWRRLSTLSDKFESQVERRLSPSEKYAMAV